jgi:hypothetical protein
VSVVDVTATASKSVAITSFVLNVFLSASLQLLWGMINALQIINHLPLFNLYMPASAQTFFKAVNDIAEFKIIPTEQVVDWLLRNNPESILKELGPLFLVLILGAVLLLVMLLLYCCSERFDYVFDVYYYLKYLIFWNGPIRYFFEGYMELSLISLLAVAEGLDWSTNFARMESLLVIAILALVFLLPILLTSYFRSRHSFFRDGEFLDKFKEVVEDLSHRRKNSPYFIAIYCYRRLA